MARQIQIEIPKPCHENWDAMTPEQKGKFCGVCSKTVVDFSLMGDGQIIETLQHTTGSICGRFSNDQLERPLVKPLQPKWYTAGMWKYVLSSFLLFKVANVKAQKNPEIISCPKPNPNNHPKLMGKIALPVQTNIKYSGTVVNEAGMPLQGVHILEEVTGQMVKTDKKGRFTLITKKNTTVLISSFGYENLRTTLSEKGTNRFVMSRAIIRTMGIVAYDYQEKLNPAPKQEFLYLLKDSITGNPVPFATATILYKGRKTVAVANENGELKINSDNNAGIMDITIQSVGYKEMHNSQFNVKEANREIILTPEIKIAEQILIYNYTMGSVKKPATICTTKLTGETLQEKSATTEKNTVSVKTLSNPVNNKLFNIYPNPVNPGGKLQLQYFSDITETGMFQLNTAEGKIILLQKVQIQKGTNEFQMNIPEIIPAQVLVVQLMNSIGKWVASEKLLVQ